MHFYKHRQRSESAAKMSYSGEFQNLLTTENRMEIVIPTIETHCRYLLCLHTLDDAALPHFTSRV